jgi:hypothetical protein
MDDVYGTMSVYQVSWNYYNNEVHVYVLHMGQGHIVTKS